MSTYLPCGCFMTCKGHAKVLQIALDCDGVIADFNGALSDALAVQGCGRYTDESYHTWELKECIRKEHHAALDRVGADRSFCAKIPRYPGSESFYRELRGLGRVLAVTTKWKSSTWIEQRYDWLLSFGFSDPEIHIVHSHQEKYAVPCDVVIEDRVQTLQDWPMGPTRILIDRPWNRQSLEHDECQGILRAYSYSDVLRFVEGIKNASL